MGMKPISSAIPVQSPCEAFSISNPVDAEATTMASIPAHKPVLLPISTSGPTEATQRKVRQAGILLLGLALVMIPPQAGFGQSNQQQEQQQREQQEREQQQRDQQQREQQQREQQQRDQQQREQQQREQQQRDQQQREQQEREQQQRDQQQREQQEREQQQRDQQQREQQQREQQQRDQQQREQQQREQQQRDQQQREQQQREQQQREQQQRDQQQRMQQEQHSSNDSSSQPSNASPQEPRPMTARAPATDVNSSSSDIRPVGMERKVSSVSAPATKDHASTPAKSDLRRTLCKDGPCVEPAPKPVPPAPVSPSVPRKLCKDGPCPVCPSGQSTGKDGACAPPSRVVKNANLDNAGSARNTVQQPCPAGQIWDGAQCAIVGAQQCLPGQSKVGASCQAQPDCTIATASSQNVILELRSARLQKDDVCLRNPTGQECQQAEAHYDLLLNEYRNFLGGVPTECRTTLPDPIAI